MEELDLEPKRYDRSIIPDQQKASVSHEEAVQLAATDGVFFSHYFFPRTVRQTSPQFHYDMWKPLLSNAPEHRHISFQIFRGGAKTSILRLLSAHRVGYGMARTMMYIGKSQDHALRSTGWLQRQIERNQLYANTFGLNRGSKWQSVEFEIKHDVEGLAIWGLAAGIEGAVRGVNIDDYRPNFILLDDVISDENAATDEQREKIWDLILGAVKESLTPRSEDPYAKLVMLNTPLNREDASMKTKDDPEWHFMRYGCFTPETENLPLEQQESIWPQRWPSEELRLAKLAAIKRNKLSTWLREKECKLTDPENTAFKQDWIRYWYGKQAIPA